MPYQLSTAPTKSVNPSTHRRSGVHQIDNGSRAAGAAVLLLRASLGIVFVAHAWLKLDVYTLPGTAEFFSQHGFAGWTAYPVFLVELIGGIALILGAYTRWVAMALVPIVVGALSVHWPNGWSFTAPNGGWEYVAFLLAALLVQAGLGDGPLALSTSWKGMRR